MLNGNPLKPQWLDRPAPECDAVRVYLNGAFAGIGHPEKFYDPVAEAGGKVALSRSFPDHHVYAEDELAELLSTAKAADLGLDTTAKDAARLRHGATPPGFLEKLSVLEIETVFEPDHTPQRIVDETLEAWRRRRVGG